MISCVVEGWAKSGLQLKLAGIFGLDSTSLELEIINFQSRLLSTSNEVNSEAKLQNTNVLNTKIPDSHGLVGDKMTN